MEKKDEKLTDALLKVALGFQVSETVEEYADVDGKLKLTKRKKTKKDVPPDLKAVQLLLSSGESTDFGGWTDEALQAEKERLLAELQKQALKRTVKAVDDEAEKTVGDEKSGLTETAERSVTKKTAVKKETAKKTVKKSKAKAQTKGTRGATVKKEE